MICTKVGLYLYIEEINKKELNYLKKVLTWTNTYSNITTCILFQDDKTTKYYFYYGLYYLLKEKLNITITNDIQIQTETEKPNIPSNYLSGINLYDYQVMAIQKALMLKQGILSLATSAGKTEILSGIIKYLDENKKVETFLCITPSVLLAKQLKERMILRGINKNDIGLFYGGKNKSIKKITIAVINSLYNVVKEFSDSNSEIIDYIKNTKFIAIDEAHHIQNSSHLSVLELANSEYLISLTGTPFHCEGDILNRLEDATLFGVTGGRIIMKVRTIDLIKRGIVATPYVYMHNLGMKPIFFANKFDKVYSNYIVNNKIRNDIICSFVRDIKKLNLYPVILVQRKDHARILMSELRELNTIAIYGNSSGECFDIYGTLNTIKVDYDIFRNEFQSGKYDCAIFTQVADEGLDLPKIDVLIQAGAGKSLIKVNQRAGRGLRKKATGLNRVFFLDFWDNSHIYLLSQSKKRKILYEEMGTIIINNLSDLVDLMKETAKSR